MRWINRVFHRLQPVAVIQLVSFDPALAVFPSEHIPARQQRPRLRSQISPQQSTQFLNRIRGVFDLVFKSALNGLSGLFKTLPGAVEFPTVIRAANAFLIDAAKSERSFAMRALLGNHTVAASPVAEHNKIFT